MDLDQIQQEIQNAMKKERDPGQSFLLHTMAGIADQLAKTRAALKDDQEATNLCFRQVGVGNCFMAPDVYGNAVMMKTQKHMAICVSEPSSKGIGLSQTFEPDTEVVPVDREELSRAIFQELPF